MDLSQLRALAATVDEGSFEAAAATLHLTPSAVSQRIKALETSTGRILVKRTKPTAVTEAGEPYLRLARQVTALVLDTERVDEDVVSIPLAMSSDALSTWVLPALPQLPPGITLDLRREDQDHSADLLRSGSVMAAITTDAQPVQGCTSTRLGTMRYRPMVAPAFAARWFADGVTADALAVAPMVVFDRKDELQQRYLRTRTRATPPRHYIPSSTDFAEAVRLGLGWAMLPDQQTSGWEEGGHVIDLDPGQHVDVTLYWQQWSLHTPALDTVAGLIMSAARSALS
jgi:LysR family transcriptional regulator (chromosome initiation inhibitor)